MTGFFGLLRFLAIDRFATVPNVTAVELFAPAPGPLAAFDADFVPVPAVRAAWRWGFALAVDLGFFLATVVLATLALGLPIAVVADPLPGFDALGFEAPGTFVPGFVGPVFDRPALADIFTLAPSPVADPAWVRATALAFTAFWVFDARARADLPARALRPATLSRPSGRLRSARFDPEAVFLPDLVAFVLPAATLPAATLPGALEAPDLAAVYFLTPAF